MKAKLCPQLVSAAIISPELEVDVCCLKERCSYYDEHAQQCSQVSQAMALRDIAEQLKRNADAMMDYSPAKEPPVDVELQPIKMCSNCKFNYKDDNHSPCFNCIDKQFWAKS